MATINTGDDRQLRESLYRLVGYRATVVIENGDARSAVTGVIVGSEWRVKARRGLHILPDVAPGTLVLPFGEINIVSVEGVAHA